MLGYENQQAIEPRESSREPSLVEPEPGRLAGPLRGPGGGPLSLLCDHREAWDAHVHGRLCHAGSGSPRDSEMN